jgi:hypothetical protein
LPESREIANDRLERIGTYFWGGREMPNKKSDAEFRKELINADMSVFDSITKRQTAARKYKAEKNVTTSSRTRPR